MLDTKPALESSTVWGRIIQYIGAALVALGVFGPDEWAGISTAITEVVGVVLMVYGEIKTLLGRWKADQPLRLL